MNRSLGDGWAVNEIVERNGTIHRVYSYKGKTCKRITLDSQIAKQLAGYVLIEKDLRSASLWLDEVMRIQGNDLELEFKGSQKSPDRERYNIIKGLFVAALTFYGKAFAQAEGRRVKLERKQLSEEFHKIHDEAIAFRNNFAAHSGAKLVERAQVALVLPPKGKRVLPMIYREMDQPDIFISTAGEKAFPELVKHAYEIPTRKIAELDRKIFAEEVLPKGYDYWKKM